MVRKIRRPCHNVGRMLASIQASFSSWISEHILIAARKKNGIPKVWLL